MEARQSMTTALYTFIALLTLIIIIAIISIYTSRRSSKTSQLDNELFEKEKKMSTLQMSLFEEQE
jgi:uncharacterized membrane-anchored protein YhcB (DUF1043 family)